MKNTIKILAAVAAGVAAGVVSGVLFAPENGAETGKKIADAAKDKYNKAKEKVRCTEDGIAKTVEEKIEAFA